MRNLRGRPEGDLVGRADLGQYASWLHGVRDQTRLDIATRDYDVGSVDSCLDVVGLELPDVALVGPVLLVHQRCPVLERSFDIGDRAERLVVDLDQLCRVLGECTTLRDDDRDSVALEARLADGERIVRRHLDVLGDWPRAGK